jgi:hypothetical protein
VTGLRRGNLMDQPELFRSFTCASSSVAVETVCVIRKRADRSSLIDTESAAATWALSRRSACDHEAHEATSELLT